MLLHILVTPNEQVSPGILYFRIHCLPPVSSFAESFALNATQDSEESLVICADFDYYLKDEKTQIYALRVK